MSKTRAELCREVAELRDELTRLENGLESPVRSEGAVDSFSESIPALLVWTDGAGYVVTVSRECSERFGFDAEDIRGRRLEDFMTEGSRRTFLAESWPCLLGAGKLSAVVCQFSSRYSGTIDALVSSSVERDAEGGCTRMVFALQEVTVLNRAYAQLRASEQRYSMLLEAITDYVYTVGVENGHPFSTVHGAGCVGVTGFTSQEYEEDPYLWYRMVHEDDRDSVVQVSINILSGDVPPPLEHRIWHKDGTIRWVRNVTVPHYDEEGRLTAYDGLISDVTDRKRAEEAMRASEARFRALIENGSDIITIVAPDGRIMYQSPSMEHVMGYRSNELVGLNRFDFLHPDTVDETRRIFHGILDLSGDAQCYEEVFRHSDGSWRMLDVVARNLTMDRHIRGVVITSRDVTERKRQEAALVLFRNALDSARDAIYIIDSTTLRVLDCSATTCAMLGYTREEILGQDPSVTSPVLSNDKRSEIVKALMQSDPRSCSLETVHRRKDGSEFPVEVFLHVVDADSGPVLVSVVRDISNQKRADAERENLESRLRQAQKMEAVGQLAGGIAHDFNNLLTGILGNINLAQSETDSSQVQIYLSQAETASLRAGNLVKQLLVFSRKSQVTMSPVDVRVVICDVVDMIKKTFDRRIEIVVDLPEDMSSIKGDVDQVHTVLLNLCVNARDAVEESMRETGNQDLRIVLSTGEISIDEVYCQRHQDARPGRFVRIAVSDTGKGMPEDVKDRIFDPFFTTKAIGKGTGLGLATVYGIVKQHGGWVDFVSTTGKGSTFFVFLPVFLGKRQTSQDAAASSATPRGSETILLVDDEEIVRTFAKTLLERLGYRVLVAADGREGLDMYFEQPDSIDVVLLDLSMPYLSGREVLEQIRAVRPAARVIISSGYSEDGINDVLGDLGASGYIAKPYEIAVLAQKLRSVIDRPVA